MIRIQLLLLILVNMTSNPLKGHYWDPNHPTGIRVVIPYNDGTIEVYGKNNVDDDMFILEGK